MLAAMDVFQQYSSFSQLVLNFHKTMVIPLFYPDALDKAAGEIRRILPTGMDLTYVRKALYLGILLGPESIDQGWHTVLKKFRSRCNQWEHSHLGVHLDVLVYKAFCLSILQFYLQFYRLTPEVLQAEKAAHKTLFKSPGNWLSRKDFHLLKYPLGCKSSLPFVEHLSLAARFRLFQREQFLSSNDKQ